MTNAQWERQQEHVRRIPCLPGMEELSGEFMDAEN